MTDRTPDTQPDDGFDTEGLDAAELALLRSAGVAGPGPDRFLSPDIETATGLVASGAVRAVALPATPE